MLVPPDHHSPCARLGHRMAARLLSGSGIARLHAYRQPGAEPLTAMAHGRSGNRVVLVVGPGDDTLALIDGPTDVRLHIHRQADLAEARVAVADVHALGRARRVRSRRAAEILGARAGGNAAVAAGDPRSLVLDVRFQELVLHGPLGAQRLPLSAIPGPEETWNALDAQDETMRCGERLLSDLADAVETEAIQGRRHATQAPRQPFHPLQGRMLPVDVDPWGVLLLDLRGAAPTTVHVPFRTPAVTTSDIPLRLAELHDRALSTPSPPRI